MKNVAVSLKLSFLITAVLVATTANAAFAANPFSSVMNAVSGAFGGGGTESSDSAPNKNDSVEGMQERRYNYLESAEGAGARASTQPSYGFGGSDVRDSKGTAQPGMIMGARLNGTLYSEIPMTPLATITFPVANKSLENEMYTHCPPLTGYHLTDSADYINTSITNDVLLGKLSDPERWVPVAKTAQQAQNTQTGNMMAEMARNQANSAIDFCSTYLTNFTTAKRWNDVRDKLFIPIAILLLLPGAVLAQVKAIVAAGNPVLDETHPFEGILRSIVAIFLIPATCLVLNYGIDLSNSLTYTIKTEYQNIFHEDMYQSAICAEVRAFPVRQEAENRGAMDLPTTKMGQLLPEQKTVFARVEGELFSTKLEDPCANLYNAPADRADEALPTKVVAARLAFNSMNAILCAGWNALCAFQTVYLYYLWLMGPIVAALWVWPMKMLRDALPSWIEGCITLCFWSLLWNTTILLMAAFRGYDETGTFVMTALNTLATICVKYSFDFVGLVMAAGQQANALGEKLSSAMQSGGGGGGGSASRSGGAGGGHHTHTGPASRPAGGVNAAHVLGGGGAHGAGVGGGVGGSGVGAGANGGHAGPTTHPASDTSSPLSLMSHAGGASGVGGGLGAIAHGGIPGSAGGTMPLTGNLSHGAQGIAGIAGAGNPSHAMPPSAQFDVVSNTLNSHGTSNFANMVGGDISHLSSLNNLSSMTNVAGDMNNLTSMMGGSAGGLNGMVGGDINNLASMNIGGAIGGANIMNGGDVTNMASSILGGASIMNGGDVTNMASSMLGGANIMNGGDVSNLASSFMNGADIDNFVSNASSFNGGDIANMSSVMNIAGALGAVADAGGPPLSASDVNNNIASLIDGTDVTNVAGGSVVDAGDVNNLSSSNMSASISGDVNVGGASFSATMNGGDVNNSVSSNSASVHSSVASNVMNGGDVNHSNSTSMSNSVASSLVNNLDVNNAMNASNSVVNAGVDISSTMASSMDVTNMSATSASMNTDVDVSSSSMVNNVDVNSIGPSSMTSTSYDVDNNVANSVANNVDVSNSNSSSYSGGSSNAQYVSGGGVQYASAGGSEARSANTAANLGSAIQSSIAGSLTGMGGQAPANAMQQMYNMFDAGTNNSSSSSATYASFDNSVSGGGGTQISTTEGASASYPANTSYGDNTSVSMPPQVSYSGGDVSYSGGSTSYSGGDTQVSYGAQAAANAAAAAASGGSNVVQSPSYSGGASSSGGGQTSYSSDSGSGAAPVAFSFGNDSNSGSSGGVPQSGYTSDSTSIATPVASNYDSSASGGGTTYSQSGDSGSAGAAPTQQYYSDGGSSAPPVSSGSSATYYIDNTSGSSYSSGHSAEYAARYAMPEPSSHSHSSAGGPPMNGGDQFNPPSMVIVPMSFNKQAAPLQDLMKQGLKDKKEDKPGEAKPDGAVKNMSTQNKAANSQSKLGNALRGAGCPLPAGDRSAVPPGTQKPAHTNGTFAAGQPSAPPVTRTDAMDIAAGNTRNRYRTGRKMTEEEIRELEESAGSWLV